MKMKWRKLLFPATAATALVIGAGASGLRALAWNESAEPSSPPTSAFAEGAVTLVKPASPFDKKNMHSVTLGERLEFQCSFFIDDFFNKSIIWAGADVRNPTGQIMYFEYSVAFFDEHNRLLGCTSQGSYGGVEPGGTTHLGSCMIELDPRDIDRVRRFQARVYESTREIGATERTESAGDLDALSGE